MSSTIDHAVSFKYHIESESVCKFSRTFVLGKFIILKYKIINIHNGQMDQCKWIDNSLVGQICHVKIFHMS